MKQTKIQAFIIFKHLAFGDGGTEQIAWNKKCNKLCNVLEGNERWKIKQTWTRELGECGARSFQLSTVWSRAGITMRTTPEPRLEGNEAVSPWPGGEEDPGEGNHGHQQGTAGVDAPSRPVPRSRGWEKNQAAVMPVLTLIHNLQSQRCSEWCWTTSFFLQPAHSPSTSGLLSP